MGSWINKEGWAIAPMHMSDEYLLDVIAFMAVGGGWSAGVVLGCIDEVYGTACARGLLKGLRAYVLKRHTIRLWTKDLRLAYGYKPKVEEVPWWVFLMLKKIGRHGRSCE